MREKRIIVLCAHDGITTYYCGVGKVVKNMLSAFEKIAKNDNDKYELHIFTPYVDRQSSFFRKDAERQARMISRLSGGDLHEIRVVSTKDIADINSNWGEKQWNLASKKVSDFVKSVEGREVIFIAHDIYFGLVCHYLPKRAGITGCYIPHSTGKLFKEPCRFASERLILRSIGDKNFKVGYISEFMKSHLKRNYCVDEGKLVPIKNALLLDDYKICDRDKGGLLAAQKELKKIGKNKKIIFSYGRCSRQKGYHTLIDAFSKSGVWTKDYKLVLLAPTDITDEKYLQLINSKLNTLDHGSYNFITEFMSPLPFLKSDKVKIIVLSSKFECAPITALEVARYANQATVIYSRIEPFKEVFLNLPGTKIVSRDDINSWSSEIKKSISSPYLGKRKIHSVSYESGITNLLRILEKQLS